MTAFQHICNLGGALFTGERATLRHRPGLLPVPPRTVPQVQRLRVAGGAGGHAGRGRGPHHPQVPRDGAAGQFGAGEQSPRVGVRHSDISVMEFQRDRSSLHAVSVFKVRLGQPDPGQRQAVPRAALRGIFQLSAADRVHPLGGREERPRQHRGPRRGLCRLLLGELRHPCEGRQSIFISESKH